MSIDYEVVQQSCVWLEQVLTKYLVILLFKAFIHAFIYQMDSGYIYIQPSGYKGSKTARVLVFKEFKI